MRAPNRVSLLTHAAPTFRFLAITAAFLGIFVLTSALALSQEGKRSNNSPPSQKPSPKPEVCAPPDASPKAMPSAPASDATAPASSASEETASDVEPTLKLKSSLDDRQDIVAVDCSKEPDASSAACQRKQSKASANQCERTEGDSDLALRKQ